MDADTSLKVLVIILSFFLAVFLLTSIFVLFKILEILKSVKRIMAKAEKLTDKVEAIGEFFENARGPAAIGRLISNIVQAVRHHKAKK